MNDTNANARRLTRMLPFLALWVAVAAVGGIGIWMVLSGNQGQADFYNLGGSDYLELLTLQSKTSIGGLLVAVGALGLIVALATLARNRSGALAASKTVSDAAGTASAASVEPELADDGNLLADELHDDELLVDDDAAPRPTADAEPVRA